MPARWRSLLFIFTAVTLFYWKLTLTRQYEFLESFDLANQVLPWLEVQVDALKHFQVALWTPYEWYGQPLLGQMQPGVFSPFTWLLALAPLRDAFLQFHWVNWWFVLIHMSGSFFMWAMLRDLGLRESASIVSAVAFACIGFYGNTDWPQQLAPAVWSPLVFLYLFRALNGRRPLASSCLAGVFTGIAWLSGYFATAYYLTFAAVIAFAAALWRSPQPLARKARWFAAFVLVTGAVGAPQILPASEYGREAIRWTKTGALRWDQKVGLPEHFEYGMKGIDLVHLVIPGADLHSEPFTGAIALALAALGMAGARWRLEKNIFAALAITALLFSLARANFLYGAFYVLIPLLEKSRAPVTSMCIMHFAVAALAGFGIHNLLSGEFPAAARLLIKSLAWFGGAFMILLTVLAFLAPQNGSAIAANDPRHYPLAFAAILFAATCLAFTRSGIGPRTAAFAIGFLVLFEQAQMAGYNWPHRSETARRTLLPPLEDTRDIADFLRPRQPARVEIRREDGGPMFIFGDWFRIHAVESLTASLLAETMDAQWWPERSARLYGVRYAIARAPTRPGQHEVFRGKSGLVIYENPGVMPRAWTVHAIQSVPTNEKAIEETRSGSYDFSRIALMPGAAPQLEQCDDPASVKAARFGLNSVSVNVNMGCRGLLIVSDSWFPGWSAGIDGRSSPIYRVDGSVRGVVVPQGPHTVTMQYRPWTALGGLAMMFGALAATAFASWRER